MQIKETQGDSFPITKLLPNIATIIGLCFGLFALKAAIASKWELAVGLIVVATFIDGIDGRLARMLNASSNFGAQLDSLADFFNFGVAPALVLYLWRGHEIKGFGWAIALFFIISQALRLARFNSALEEGTNDDRFFFGVPAPCGAGLALVPIMLTFLFDQELGYHPFEITPLLVSLYMAVIALLMVSRIPTISVKKVKVKRQYATFLLAFVALLVISLILEPWIVLPLMGLGYLATIPFSVIFYYSKGQKTGSKSE